MMNPVNEQWRHYTCSIINNKQKLLCLTFVEMKIILILW